MLQVLATLPRMTPRTFAGWTAALLLPWLIALAGFLFGTGAWLLRARLPLEMQTSSKEDAPEVKTLRLALATARAENDALRRELDRLLTSEHEARGSQAQHVSPAPRTAQLTTGEASPTDGRREEIAAKLKESVALAAVGDEQAKQQIVLQMMQLGAGSGSFDTLREVYLGASDPRGRELLLTPMLLTRSPDVKDFIAEELRSESDPDLRRSLMEHAATVATPEIANKLQGTFLEYLRSSGEPEARLAALRGLRFARSEEVVASFVQAASDPVESVRLAAIEALASRPQSRERLRELVENDPSAHVREIGQCRLLLAGELG